MIKVVVFDFDGTLVDSNSIKHRTFDEVVADLPGGPEALALARRTGGDRYRMFADVARRLGGEETLGAQLATEYTRRCLRGIAWAPERRGAAAALRTLSKRGIKIWVNSSTPRQDLPALLQARGILRFTAGVLGAPRSKAYNLRTILLQEQAKPREAVVVGDGRDDETAARRVGAWSVAITAEGRASRRTGYAMPDLVRLPEVVLRLSSGRRRRR